MWMLGPTRDREHLEIVLALTHLEMFASTQDHEFVQGQSGDVPNRELVLNMDTTT